MPRRCSTHPAVVPRVRCGPPLGVPRSRFGPQLPSASGFQGAPLRYAVAGEARTASERGRPPPEPAFTRSQRVNESRTTSPCRPGTSRHARAASRAREDVLAGSSSPGARVHARLARERSEVVLPLSPSGGLGTRAQRRVRGRTSSRSRPRREPAFTRAWRVNEAKSSSPRRPREVSARARSAACAGGRPREVVLPQCPRSRAVCA